METYTNSFDYNIRSILISFPEDYKKKDDNKLLWGSSKIRPHQIPFDLNNPLCIQYIQVFIKILSHALGLEFNKSLLSDENIKKICEKIKLPEFKAHNINENEIEERNENNQESQNENLEENQKSDEEIINKINNIVDELEKINEKKYDFNKINTENFEKDHDENGHIDFIHLSSTLRAKNYNIQPCERNKTKMVAGKIIPTILTSTASIAGISSLQVFTLLQTHDINYLRKCFFNLGRVQFILQKPRKPIYKNDVKVEKKEGEMIDLSKSSIKVIPKSYSCWDKIVIKGSKTCKEMLDYLKETYNIDVDILNSGEIILFNTFGVSKAKNMGKKLEDIYNEKSKFKLDQNYMIINVIASISNTEIEGVKIEEASVDMPIIKYIFK